MIEPTDEMRDAFLTADREYRKAELDRLGFHGLHLPTLNEGAFTAALAAVIAIVERDYLRVDGVHRDGRVCRPGNKCVYCTPPPRAVVHLLTAGDEHVHCCGRQIGDLPNRDRTTLNPHGVTCKGTP